MELSEKNLEDILQITVNFGWPPGRTANYLHLPMRDVVDVFEKPKFRDLVKQGENKVIHWAMLQAQTADISYQAFVRRMRTSSHMQRLEQARDLLHRHVPGHGRWPPEGWEPDQAA